MRFFILIELISLPFEHNILQAIFEKAEAYQDGNKITDFGKQNSEDMGKTGPGPFVRCRFMRQRYSNDNTITRPCGTSAKIRLRIDTEDASEAKQKKLIAARSVRGNSMQTVWIIRYAYLLVW